MGFVETRILGLCGSLHPDSASRWAMQRVLQACTRYGAVVEELDLAALDLPYCTGTYELEAYPPEKQPALRRLRDQIRAADGLLIATPEYHGGLSGVLKNALDHLDPDDTRGKVAGLVAAAGRRGGLQTLGQLRLICRHLLINPVPVQVVINRAIVPPDAEATARDPDVEQRIQGLARELVRVARLYQLGEQLGDRIFTLALASQKEGAKP